MKGLLGAVGFGSAGFPSLIAVGLLVDYVFKKQVSFAFIFCECKCPSLELDKGWVGRRKETHENSNVGASGSVILPSHPARMNDGRVSPTHPRMA